MIKKIKEIPGNIAFGVGLTLILVSGLMFSFDNWISMIVRGIVLGVAILFILSAADKRFSRIDKKR